MYTFKTSGVCSKEIKFDVRGGKVYSVSFLDGCDGNLKAIGILVDGMDARELVNKLKGLRCGRRATSCADQLAIAVAQAIEQQK